MPTSADDVLATGQTEIAAIPQGTAVVEIDGILFKAEFVRYVVRTRPTLSATARLPSCPPIAPPDAFSRSAGPRA